MSITAPHIDTHLDLQALQNLQTYLSTKLEGLLSASTLAVRELALHTTPDNLLKVLQTLRDDKKTRFTMLIDITAVDWLGNRPAYFKPDERFEVVYHLLSIETNQRIRIKVPLAVNGQGETLGLPSAIPLYPNANWYERETWDMFGIPFQGHPDLRRILTDYDFNGHPLRKDFPLEGFVETYYDPAQQRVAYKPVDLPQEFRQFGKLSEWEGITGNSHLAEEDNKPIPGNNFNREEFK